MDDQPVPTATQDELDLLACCLAGWSPLDVDITDAEFDQWVRPENMLEAGH